MVNCYPCQRENWLPLLTNVAKKELEDATSDRTCLICWSKRLTVVVNSDAGAGVGYSGIRIRGFDITRINVTINGIPVNDAESHGVFFVDMPDWLLRCRIFRYSAVSGLPPTALGLSEPV